MPQDRTLITPRLAGGIVPRVTHTNTGNTFGESSVGLAEFEVDYEVPACNAGTVANATLAVLLPDFKVPVGHRCVITDFHVYFPGPTTWSPNCTMILRDSAGGSSYFDQVSWDQSLTAAGTLIRAQSSPQSGVSYFNAFKTQAGGATGKGLILHLSASSNPSAGSAFRVHLRGYFRRA